MMEIASPFSVTEANGVPVRAFLPPVNGDDMPWFALDDILASAGLASFSVDAVTAAYQAMFPAEFRSIAQRGGKLTVASSGVALLLTWALEGWAIMDPAAYEQVSGTVVASVAAYARCRPVDAVLGEAASLQAYVEKIGRNDWLRPDMREGVVEMVEIAMRAGLWRHAAPVENVS